MTEIHNPVYRDMINQLLDMKETIINCSNSIEYYSDEAHELNVANEHMTSVIDGICRAEELVRVNHYFRLKGCVSAVLDNHGTIVDAMIIRNEIEILENLLDKLGE